MEDDVKRQISKTSNSQHKGFCPFSHKSGQLYEGHIGCHNCFAPEKDGVFCKICEFRCCAKCLPYQQILHNDICGQPNWKFKKIDYILSKNKAEKIMMTNHTCFYCTKEKAGVLECMSCKMKICQKCQIQKNIFNA